MKTNIFTNKKPYFVTLAIKLGLLAFLLVSDLVTKQYFATHYAGTSSASFFGIFSFTYVENTGAAFSLFSGNTTVLAVLSVAFVLAFFVYDLFNYSKNPWYVLGFAFIVAGAVGNMVDRIWLGYVRDFIRFDFVTFPIFNVADMCLTIGLVLYAVYILFYFQTTKEGK